MPDRDVDFLLIGGGMASAHCAAELRRRGAEGSIMLVGREPEPPYERPPISKEYLGGDAGREDAHVNPPSWYEENGIELRLRTRFGENPLAAEAARLFRSREVSPVELTRLDMAFSVTAGLAQCSAVREGRRVFHRPAARPRLRAGDRATQDVPGAGHADGRNRLAAGSRSRQALLDPRPVFANRSANQVSVQVGFRRGGMALVTIARNGDAIADGIGKLAVREGTDVASCEDAGDAGLHLDVGDDVARVVLHHGVAATQRLQRGQSAHPGELVVQVVVGPVQHVVGTLGPADVAFCDPP